MSDFISKYQFFSNITSIQIEYTWLNSSNIRDLVVLKEKVRKIKLVRNIIRFEPKISWRKLKYTDKQFIIVWRGKTCIIEILEDNAPFNSIELNMKEYIMNENEEIVAIGINSLESIRSNLYVKEKPEFLYRDFTNYLKKITESKNRVYLIADKRKFIWLQSLEDVKKIKELPKFCTNLQIKISNRLKVHRIIELINELPKNIAIVFWINNYLYHFKLLYDLNFISKVNEFGGKIMWNGIEVTAKAINNKEEMSGFKNEIIRSKETRRLQFQKRFE